MNIDSKKPLICANSAFRKLPPGWKDVELPSAEVKGFDIGSSSGGSPPCLLPRKKTPMQSSLSGDCIGVTSYITIINCPKSVPIILPEYPPSVTDFQLCTHFHWSLRRLCIMPSVVISGKNNPLLHHPQQINSSLYTAALRFL